MLINVTRIETLCNIFLCYCTWITKILYFLTKRKFNLKKIRYDTRHYIVECAEVLN